MSSPTNLPSGLMVGTGEYTTGYVHDRASTSDKSAGVVALTLFDLQSRGVVGRLAMAGTNGTKFPAIRRHLEDAIASRYRGLQVAFDSYPDDQVAEDRIAYRQALDSMSPGDFVAVFTPDDYHYSIAQDAIERGCHVLLAKPPVKTLSEHLALIRAAESRGVLVAIEVHKRWDPIYADARDRIADLGDFGFFSSYMSQPKSQLETFRSWAGRGSDISYYLNAHHIDFNLWAVQSFARPQHVAAVCSAGVARGRGVETEDTITLAVQWVNLASGNQASATYTSSWSATRGDVHSQQRFFYMGHRGELQVDQAHRGFTAATDQEGYASLNPLFMKYTPDAEGEFAGQDGYGYRSIESFVKAVAAIRRGEADAYDFQGRLATIQETSLVTAVLEAGRRSLDDGGRRIRIDYDGAGSPQSLTPV